MADAVAVGSVIQGCQATVGDPNDALGGAHQDGAAGGLEQVVGPRRVPGGTGSGAVRRGVVHGGVAAEGLDRWAGADDHLAVGVGRVRDAPGRARRLDVSRGDERDHLVNRAHRRGVLRGRGAVE